MRKILLSESTKKHILLSGPLRRTHKARPDPSYKPKAERAVRKKSEATELSLRKDKSGKRKIPYRYRLQEKDRSGVMSSDVFKGLRQKEL